VTGGIRRAKPEGSRGFALIVVLWFLVLIAAIGTYLMINARTETAIARNVRLAASVEALADAGIAQAAFNLTDTVESNHWKLDGTPHRLKLAEGELVIRLFDENAKINPNHASDVLLAALFEAAGIERMRARRLGAAVADWVGPDMMPRPFGAKLEQYRQAGLSYGPPNAPIESLDELQLVLGMSPEIYAAVRPYLTIYTVGEPMTENASPVVQRAIALAVRKSTDNPATVEDTTARSITQSDATQNDPEAPPPPDARSAPAAEASAPNADRTEIPVVKVVVDAQVPADGVFIRQAVLRLDPTNPKGYSVLDWQRGDLPASD
jgi:general secretion pathway protein K